MEEQIIGVLREQDAGAKTAPPTRRPFFPAWAKALRTKWTLQPCQVAGSTFDTAALISSCASETTSMTPRRHRLVSLRRNSVQIASASDVPISMPSTSRRPSAHRNDDGNSIHR